MIHYLPVVMIAVYVNGLLSASLINCYLNDHFFFLFIIAQSLLVIHLDCLFYDKNQNFSLFFNLFFFFMLYQTLLIKNKTNKSRFYLFTTEFVFYIKIHWTFADVKNRVFVIEKHICRPFLIYLKEMHLK
jgi:hypothetical protein